MKIYGDITKTEVQSDGTIKVSGVASAPVVDSDGETITANAMKMALPDYMKFGAVREMHGPSAAGTAIKAEVLQDGRTAFEAHIVDPVAVLKVRTGVYKGFSVGGRVLQRDPMNKSIITAMRLSEISLVDRPACPVAMFNMFKSAGDDTMSPKQQALADATEAFKQASTSADDIAKGADTEATKVAKAAAEAAETVMKAAQKDADDETAELAKAAQKLLDDDAALKAAADLAAKAKAGSHFDPQTVHDMAMGMGAKCADTNKHDHSADIAKAVVDNGVLTKALSVATERLAEAVAKADKATDDLSKAVTANEALAKTLAEQDAVIKGYVEYLQPLLDQPIDKGVIKPIVISKSEDITADLAKKGIDLSKLPPEEQARELFKASHRQPMTVTSVGGIR